MAAIPINFKIERGVDFYATLTLNNEYNQPVNLNSYNVVAKYSNSYISSTKYDFIVNVINATGGIIEIKLNSAQTSVLKLPRYVYDIVITSPLNTGGIKSRVVQGILEISPGIS
jgi:hypothetical protein